LRLVLSIAFYAVFRRRIFLRDVIHVTKKYGVKIRCVKPPRFLLIFEEVSRHIISTPYFDAVFSFLEPPPATTPQQRNRNDDGGRPKRHHTTATSPLKNHHISNIDLGVLTSNCSSTESGSGR
jgi:hypothetical protein